MQFVDYHMSSGFRANNYHSPLLILSIRTENVRPVNICDPRDCQNKSNTGTNEDKNIVFFLGNTRQQFLVFN